VHDIGGHVRASAKLCAHACGNPQASLDNALDGRARGAMEDGYWLTFYSIHPSHAVLHAQKTLVLDASHFKELVPCPCLNGVHKILQGFGLLHAAIDVDEARLERFVQNLTELCLVFMGALCSCC
jgi:hypothetical protein